jgi:transcriptional regulator GlxA family with amidase domain
MREYYKSLRHKSLRWPWKAQRLLDLMSPAHPKCLPDRGSTSRLSRPRSLQVPQGFLLRSSKNLADAGAYDVLWVPSGDPDVLARLTGDPRHTYLDFLIRQSQQAKYVASVREGAMLLAATGLLGRL